MNVTAITAAAYRSGAHRGVLDEQQGPSWILRDSLPLTRASMDVIIAHGDPRCRGVHRWLVRRRYGSLIQAEADRGYRAGRVAEAARRKARAAVRLLPGGRRCHATPAGA